MSTPQKCVAPETPTIARVEGTLIHAKIQFCAWDQDPLYSLLQPHGWTRRTGEHVQVFPETGLAETRDALLDLVAAGYVEISGWDDADPRTERPLTQEEARHVLADDANWSSKARDRYEVVMTPAGIEPAGELYRSLGLPES